MKASKLVHKILKFINYANLCKFTEPRKGPGGAIGFFLYKKKKILLLLFIFFHVPSGASYLYFSHSNFFFLVPSRGIKCLFFDQ